MKILFLSSYFTNNAVPLLSQCKSGFGYMVYDIAKGVARSEEVDVLLLNYRYNSFDVDNIHLCGNNFRLFLKHVLHCCNVTIPLKLWIYYRPSIRSLVRVIYCWLASGHYYSIIKNTSYDVVHIHGCGYYNEIYLDICKRLNKKYVITLHGLNSFSDIIDLEPAGKKYERDFLKRVVKGGVPMTVISSGIKNTILKSYGVDSCNDITVVCNSFSFANSGENSVNCNIRFKYKIPSDSKIVLYAGNISRNKNQEQLIRAFRLLPEKIKTITYILFCGRNIEDGYQLDSFINESDCKNHFILCGNVDKELMPCYFEQSDAVALLSKAEGFGLSLIEGMHFGLPCMTFTDLDAFEDIYNECAVVGIEDRSDESVAQGLECLLTTKWDKEKIKKYSKCFENETMIENYINKYKEVVYGR